MSIRWGIIGCGDIVRKRVARAIQADKHSELWGVCRRDSSRLQEFCESFGVQHGYQSDVELLADDDIDAVYIATPVHLHLPQTVAAAEAGKHVLCEKPMAMSVAECDWMIDACRAQNVKLGIAYYRRFYPVVERGKQAIESGRIGRPLCATVVTSTAFARQPGEEGYWRVILKEGGGGALMDIGSHRINLLLELFGEVTDVAALCGNVTAGYAAEQCATVALQFASGVQGNVQCVFGGRADPDLLTVLGEQGRLSVAPLNDGQLVIEANDKTHTENHPPSENFHAPLIADFCTAILDDRAPRVNGQEGQRTSAVMERAYAAATNSL